MSVFDPGNYGLYKLTTRQQIARLSEELATSAKAWAETPDSQDNIRTLYTSIICMERLYKRMHMSMRRSFHLEPSDLNAPSSAPKDMPLTDRLANLASSYEAWRENKSEKTFASMNEAISACRDATTFMKKDISAHPAMVPTDPHVITTTEQLEAFCKKAADAPYVCVDTEFSNMYNYIPVLHMVQLAISPEEAVVVDMQAPGLDTSSLKVLMKKPDCVKVFHSSANDLAHLEHHDMLPAPVFDTQIAARFTTDSKIPYLSYAALVELTLGKTLNKEAQLSDWEVRPFTQEMITYALGDVTHLCQVYDILRPRLTNPEEINKVWQKSSRYKTLAKKQNNTPPPINKGDPKSPLKRLMWWRSREACRLNLQVSNIISSTMLEAIAQALPTDESSLAKVPGVRPEFAKSAMSHALLDLLKMPEKTREFFLSRRKKPSAPSPKPSQQ